MPRFEQFRLPDAGEGLTEAEVVTWHVAVGDRVEVNQPLVEIETAKSLVELPSPFAGTVSELLVAEGETVDVGTPILAVADAAEPAAAASPAGGEPRPVPVEVRQPDASPLDLAERILAPVLHPLATTGIVLVVAIFVLLQREDLRDRLIRLAGSTDLHRATTALDDAARRLGRFFLFQLGLNTAFGCIICAGLYAIGVPSPILWGSSRR